MCKQWQKGITVHWVTDKPASMEHLRRLQECNKRNTTLRRAFVQFGITEYDKPLKELNEKRRV